MYQGEALAENVVFDDSINSIAPGTDNFGEIIIDTSALVGEITFFLEIDASNDISENNEADNTYAFMIDVTEVSDSPELAFNTNNISVTPQQFEQLPVSIMVDAEVLNLSLQPLNDVTVGLVKQNSDGTSQTLNIQMFNIEANDLQIYQLNANIAQAQNDIQLDVVIDPDNNIAEFNENNNSHQLVVPKVSALDVAINANDVIVPASLVEGDTYDMAFLVRNSGTSTALGFNIKVYAEFENTNALIHQSQVAELKAGLSINRQFSWRPNQAGNYQLRFVVDEDNILPESDENNNEVLLPVEVLSNTLANLSIDTADVDTMPMPALQGQDLVFFIDVDNESSSAAEAFSIKLFKTHENGQPNSLMATITDNDGLAANSTESYQITLTETPLSGSHEFIIEVDGDNQVDEYNENDNNVFTTLDIFSKADAYVSGAGIHLSPAVPVLGTTLEVNINISNLGQQNLNDLSINLYYDNSQQPNPIGVASSTINELIAGQTQNVTLSFTFPNDDAIDSLIVRLDENNSIEENDESNNVANVLISNQQQNFYTSHRYISPNGDGINDTVQFFYNVEQISDHEIQLIDANNQHIKTFAPAIFNNSQFGDVIWDGRNDDNVLVRDGQYTAQLINGERSVVAQTLITVDNNQSSLIKALAQNQGHYVDLNCLGSSFGQSIFSRDGKSLFVRGYRDNNNIFRDGIYRIKNDGSALSTEVSESFLNGRDMRSFWVLDNGDLLFLIQDNSSEFQFFVKKQATGVMSQLDYPLGISFNAPRVITITDDFAITQQGFDGMLRKVYFDAQLSHQSFSTTQPMTFEAQLDTGLLMSVNADTFPFKNLYFIDFAFTTEQLIIEDIHEDDLPQINKTLLTDEGVFIVHHEGEIKVFSTQAQQLINPLVLNAEGINDSGLTVHNEVLLLNSDSSIDITTFNGTAVAQTPPHFTLSDFDRAFDLVFSIRVVLPSENEVFLDRSSAINTFVKQSLVGIKSDTDNKSMLLLIENTLVDEFISPPCDFFFDCNQWPATVEGTVGTFITAVTINYQNPQNVHVDSSVIDQYSSFEQESNRLTLNVMQEGQSNYARIDDTFETQRKVLDHQQLGQELLPENNNQQLTIINAFPHYYDSDISNFPSLIPSRDSVDNFEQFHVRSFDIEGECAINNGSGHFIYRSQDNLFADIRLILDQQAINIQATTFDQNFDRFHIHWATSTSPEQWFLLYDGINALDGEVVTNWIPPNNGIYRIRIQAFDKAGNWVEDIEQIAINNNDSDITDINVSPTHFSPDGNAVNDVVNIDYKVTAPTEVLISISNEDGQIIRTEIRQYSTFPINDGFVWDGTDDNGQLLVDGTYRIEVQGFAYTVYLDTQAIIVNDLSMSLDRPVTSSIGYGYVSQLTLPTSQVDEAINNYEDYFSHTFQHFDSNTAQWLDIEPLAIILNASDIEQILSDQYRIKITDKAGNIGFSHINLSAQRYKKVELLKVTNDNEVLNHEFFDDLVGSNASYPLYPNPEDTPLLVDWSSGDTMAYVIQAFNYQDLASISFTTRYLNDDNIMVTNDQLVSALPVSSAMSYKQAAFVSNNDNVNALFNINIDNTALPIFLIELQEQHFPNTDGVIDIEIAITEVGQAIPTVLSSQIQFVSDLGVGGDDLSANLLEIDFDPNFDARTLGLDAQHAYEHLINTVPYDENLQYLWLYQQGVAEVTNDTLVENNYFNGSLISTAAHGADFVNQTDRSVSRLYILNPNACKVRKELMWQANLIDNETLQASATITNDLCLTAELSAEFYVGDFCDFTSNDRNDIQFLLQGIDIDINSNRPFLIELYQVLAGQQQLLFADTNPQLIANQQGQFSYRGLFNYDVSSLEQGEHTFLMVINDNQGNTIRDELALNINTSAANHLINQPQNNALVCAEDGLLGREVTLNAEIAVDSVSPYYAQAQLIINGINNSNDIVYQGYNDFELLDNTSSVNTLIATASDLNLNNTPATLLVETINASGISVCNTVNFSVDAVVDFDAIDPVPDEKQGLQYNKFSPNNDGIKDTFRLATIQANENLSIDVVVYDSNNINLGTIFTQTLLNGDHHDLVWNGQIDNVLVADGIYRAEITVSDDCGLQERISIPVSVDTLAPNVTFVSPTDAGSLDNIHRVMIDIEEANLLIQGIAINPQINERLLVEFFFNGVWNVLNIDEFTINSQSGNYQAQLDWNLTALPAAFYPLRITVEDLAGNVSQTQINPELIDTQDILWNFNISPLFISPNADNIQDHLNIAFGLNVDAIIDITVLDFNNNPLFSLIDDQAFSAGAQELSFNGFNNNQVLNDGDYKIHISAAQSDNLNNTVSLALPFVVDNTAVSIQWNRPDGPVVKGLATAQITVADDNIESLVINNQQLQPLRPVNSVFNAPQTGVIELFDLSGLNEGAHQLSVTANDHAGNATTVQLDYVIDNTPPQLLVSAPENEAFFSADTSEIAIQGVISDQYFDRYDISIAQFSDTPQWQNITAGSTLGDEGQFTHIWPFNQSDGKYLLRITVIDQADWRTEQIVGLTIDTVAPQATMTAPMNNDIVATETKIIGVATDTHFDFYTLSYRSGAEQQWQLFHTSQVPVDGALLGQLPADLADGQYDIQLSVHDKAGQVTRSQISIVIDALPPLPPTNLTALVTNQRDVSLEWQASISSDASSYYVYSNGQLLTSTAITSTGYVDTGLVDGDYHYWVVTLDAVGNISQTSDAINITIDTTPPVVNIISPAQRQRVNGTLDVFGDAFSALDFNEYRVFLRASTDNLPGTLINTSTIAVNNGLMAQIDTTSMVQNSQYTIELHASDINGNSNSQQVNIIVDNIAPNTPVDLTGQLQGLNTVALQWQDSSATDLAGYLVLLNGVVISGAGDGNLSLANAINVNSFTVNDLADGDHVFNVIAIDWTGNLSALSNNFTISIDARAPDTMIIHPFDGQQFESPIIMQANSADTDLASITFEYSIDGLVWQSLSTDTSAPYQTTINPVALNLNFGEVFLRATAIDNSAQTDATPAQIRIEYADLTAPAAVEGLSASISGGDITLNWQNNSEDDLQGYVISRITNGQTQVLTTPAITSNQYTDSNLSDGHYRYQVVAFDETGNESRHQTTDLLTVFSIIVEQPYSPVLAPAQTQIQGQTPQSTGDISISIINGVGSQLLPDVPLMLDREFNSPAIDLADGINELSVVHRINPEHISRTSSVRVEQSPMPQVPLNFQAIASGLDAQLSWQVPDANTLAYIPYKNGQTLMPPVLLFAGVDFEASSNEFSVYDVLDGNPQTTWNPSFSDLTDQSLTYLQVNLDQNRLITTFDIQWAINGELINSASRFSVQFKSSVGWVTVAEIVENNQPITSISTDVPYLTDSIRIIFNTPQGVFESIRIGELHINHQPLITDSAITINETDGQYTYQVASVNNQGFISEKTTAINLDIGDVIAPDTVMLTAQIRGVNDVDLSWSASPSSDVAQYWVFRNNNLIHLTSDATILNFNDVGLANGTYEYTVRAIDAAGNTSIDSNTVTVSIDQQLLSTPQNLTAQALVMGETITLSWQTVSDPALQHYRLYRSQVSGSDYSIVADTLENTYTDTELNNGTRYYYVVVAVDNFGNESTYSNEVSAVPIDALPAAMPVITAPTVHGAPLTIDSSIVDIAGSADPGALVDLYINNQYTATTQTETEFSINEQNHFDGINQIDMSQSGPWVAYTDFDDNLVVRNVLTNESSRRFFDFPEFVWNNQGDKLYVIEFDFNFGGQKVAVYDTSLTELSIAATSDDIISAVPSPDESVLFYQGSYTDPQSGQTEQGLWLLNIGTDQATAIDFIGGVSTSNNSIQWSDNGQYLSFINNDDNSLYLYNLNDQSLSQIDIGLNGNTSLDFSPDSAYLIYDKNDAGQQLYQYDINGEHISVITLPHNTFAKAQYSTTSSINAQQILYQKDCCEAVVFDMASNTGTTIYQAPSNIRALSWSSQHGILIVSNFTLTQLTSPGGYVFNNVMLNNGINDIHTIARDASGIPSDPSLSISIELLSVGLPDLSITAQDVVINPLNALPNQAIVASALVKNLGDSVVMEADIAAQVIFSNGTVSRIPTTPNSLNLGAGQTQSVFIDIGQISELGEHILQLTLDSTNTVEEVNDNNNLVFKRISVIEALQPQLQFVVLPQQLAPSQNADINMTIYNPGQNFDGTLTLSIEDSSGFPVTADRQYAINQLASNDSLSIEDQWTTTDLFAGDYRLRANLYATDGSLVQQQIRQISIESMAEFQLMLDVSNNVIQLGDVLPFTTQLNYVLGNTPQNVSLEWQIINTNNQQVIWSDTQNISSILPGFNSSINGQWLSTFSGDFNLRLNFTSENNQQTITVPFTVMQTEQVIELAGQIQDDPRTIILGNDFNAAYQLDNIGDQDLTNIDVNLSLVDAQSFTEVATVSRTVSLLMDEALMINDQFSSQLLENNNYVLVLSADLSSVGLSPKQLLDTRSVISVDTQGPNITVINPQNNDLTAVNPEIRFSVTDQYAQVSSVQLSNADINQGQPIAFNINAFNQPYQYDLFELADGPHQFTITARDEYDNLSQETFTINVDGTAPVIAISGVTDGGLYNSAVTAEVTISDDNLNSSQIVLNGQTATGTNIISEEGNHFLMVTAVDSVGNRNTQSVNFQLDLTAPIVDITFPEDNAQLSNDRTMVVGTTEPQAQVNLTIGNQSFSTQSDINGDFSFADIPLQTGSNTINVQAQDQATNVSQLASISVTVAAAIDVQASIDVPTTAPIEQNLQLNYQLNNLLNTPLVDLPVRVQLFDGNDNTLIDTQSITANLNASQTLDQMVVFSTDNLVPEKYVVLLSILLDGQWQIRDGGQIVLKDTTAPVVHITEPQANQIYGSQLTTAVTATDQYSAVQQVSYQLNNNGLWLPMVNSNNDDFVADLTLTHGQHLIKYQVSDIIDNQAETDNIIFMVDNKAPDITINSPIDGTLTNQDVLIDYKVSDDSSLSIQVELNGMALQSGAIVNVEGQYLLTVSATDQVNNTAQQSVQFIIDKTAPELSITDLSDGQQLDINVIDINGNTEARASVSLNNAGTLYQTEADNNGDFNFENVQLNDGENTLSFAATDQANNASSETNITVTFTNTGQCQIFGFKGATPYNVLMFEDYFAQSSMAGGRVAAAGTIALDDYFLGQQLTLDLAADVLISGGDINFATGQVFFGNILAAGQANIGQEVIDNLHPDAQIISQAILPIDFDQTFEDISLFTAALAELPTNSSHQLNNGVLRLNGDCQSGQMAQQIYQISAQEMADTRSIISACEFSHMDQAPYVIINISGDDIRFTNFDGSGLSTFSQKVIFNTFEASTVHLNNSDIYGNLLAIEANIGQQAADDSIFSNGFEGQGSAQASTITGQIIGKNWYNQGMLNHKPLQCTGNIQLNAAPIINDVQLTTSQDEEILINLRAIDENRETLNHKIINAPSSGTLLGNPPQLIYKPNAGFIGDDFFNYQVTDELGQTSSATVHITILSSTNLMGQLLSVATAIVTKGVVQ